jgi:hypothetical protein
MVSSITMYNMWHLLWHIAHKNCNLTLRNDMFSNSWHLWEINCVVLSITTCNMWHLLWHLVYQNYNLTLSIMAHIMTLVWNIMCNFFHYNVHYMSHCNCCVPYATIMSHILYCNGQNHTIYFTQMAWAINTCHYLRSNCNFCVLYMTKNVMYYTM